MKVRTFQDQIAIVTGASSGIGRATALELARHGAHLALASRREDLCNELAEEIRGLKRDALVVPTDVTDPYQIKRLVDIVIECWGRIDILISNAGEYVRCPIYDLTIETLQHSLAVNYYAGVYAILAVLPHMRAKKSGYIVVMTSMDGKKGLVPDAPYVSAKFALTGFAEVLRQEVRADGIGVSNILPGRVDTPMIDYMRVPWLSAKISPERVAQTVIRAIRKNDPEVIIPRRAILLHYLNVLSPRAGDWFARKFRLEGW